MPSGRISKRTIDALTPGTGDQFLWDVDLRGFGAKITGAGTVSYLLQFRMGGREAKTRRYTIGPHGSPWTPATAREEAVRLSLLIAQGMDPVDADKQRRREVVDLAFAKYADTFVASCKGVGWRRLAERSVRLNLKPVNRR